MRLVKCDCCGITNNSFEGYKHYSLKTFDGSSVPIDACSRCRAIISGRMYQAMADAIFDLKEKYNQTQELIKNEVDKV